MKYATEGLDYYDSRKMLNNNEIPEIYSIVENTILVINSMPLLTADKDVVVGFKTSIAGIFTISNNEFTGFPAGTKVILVNNNTNEQIVISDGSVYTFASGVVTNNTMFTVKIVFDDSTPDPDPVQDIIFSVNENNRIMITCNEPIVKGATFKVTSTMGKVEFKGKITNEVTLVNKKLSIGTYIVTVINGGIVTTGKVSVGN